MNLRWMPLYIADYRADTAHLSAAEHGAYLLLIMHYWQTGGLPGDDKQLSRIACMSPSEWRKVRPTISALFKDGWRHKRIDEELAKAKDVAAARHKKASDAANSRWAKRGEGDAPTDPKVDATSNSTSNAPSIGQAMPRDAPSPSHTQEEKKESCRARGPTLDEDFEKFWKGYPRTPNMSKKEARTAWGKLSEVDREAVLVAGPKYAEWLANERRKRADAPAVHAVRFITQRRFDGFNDPPEPAEASAPDHPIRLTHGAEFRGQVYVMADTPEWDAWSRHRKRSMPTTKSGGWLFPTRWPPAHEPRVNGAAA